MKNNRLDKILWGITLFKMRYDRGNSWMNKPKDIGNIVISLYAAKSLLAEYGIPFLSGKFILLIAFGEIFFGYLIGYADELKLLLWQRENLYMAKTVNPYGQKMEDRMNELHEKIDWLLKLLNRLRDKRCRK